MPYRLLYHPGVLTRDLPLLDQKLRGRIVRAIEQRLHIEPTHYGEPLRYRLKGYWKLRVGDYRLVYTLREQVVVIVAIRHRKHVYTLLPQRLVWRPN